MLFPLLFGSVLEFFGMKICHLPFCRRHKHFSGKGSKKLIFLLLNINKNSRQISFDDVFNTALYLKSHWLPGEIIFRKINFYNQPELGIELRTLIIGIKNKITQRIENNLIADSFVIHRNVRVMRDNNIRTHFKIFVITLSCIGRGERSEFFSRMCYNNTPTAFSLNLVDSVLYCIKVTPTVTAGLVDISFSAGSLIADSEHTDSACLVKNNGLSCFVNVHSCTDSLY